LERREDLRLERIEMGYRLGFYGLLVAIAVLAADGLGLGGPSGLPQGIGQQAAAAAPLAGGDNQDNGDDTDNDRENEDDNGDNQVNADDDNDGGDNDEIVVVSPAAAAAPPPPPPSVPCGGGGQEQVYSSPDGRVAVRVPAALSRRIRVQVQYVDPSTVPPAPGQLVDRLVFDVQAQDCETGATLTDLPGEVNLGIHYAENASWPNEQAFTIAQLAAGAWSAAAKQAPDPGANYVSASINRAGRYSVYQR
jgi:hypothetical protein